MESAFLQDSHMICMHVVVRETPVKHDMYSRSTESDIYFVLLGKYSFLPHLNFLICETGIIIVHYDTYQAAIS